MGWEEKNAHLHTMTRAAPSKEPQQDVEIVIRTWKTVEIITGMRGKHMQTDITS
jgi:hypothetical protein